MHLSMDADLITAALWLAISWPDYSSALVGYWLTRLQLSFGWLLV